MDEVIKKLCDARKEAKKTQQQVADDMGVRQQVVSRIEKEGASPTLTLLKKYATAVGMKIDVVRRC